MDPNEARACNEADEAKGRGGRRGQPDTTGSLSLTPFLAATSKSPSFAPVRLFFCYQRLSTLAQPPNKRTPQTGLRCSGDCPLLRAGHSRISARAACSVCLRLTRAEVTEVDRPRWTDRGGQSESTSSLSLTSFLPATSKTPCFAPGRLFVFFQRLSGFARPPNNRTPQTGLRGSEGRGLATRCEGGSCVRDDGAARVVDPPNWPNGGHIEATLRLPLEMVLSHS